MKNIMKALPGKHGRWRLLRRAASVIAVLAMSIGLMQPAVAFAEDTQQQNQKIESFTASFLSGASSDSQGRYVWTPNNSADDHRFVFRVDYSMSGLREIPAGAIKITVPKTILRDRGGKAADYTDISIPSVEEAAAADPKDDIPYTWAYSDDGKSVVVTNAEERPAGENGYFEIAYITNERTFAYADMEASEPFHADISVTNRGQTVTAKSASIPVYINTTASIKSTVKRYPEKLYRTWQQAWGTQLEETKGKNFLVWEVISEVSGNTTQPYSFRIDDTPESKDLHVVGYSMGRQDGPFTEVNHVEGQQSRDDRHDYVLTWYDPALFNGADYYSLKNSVKATVTPEDGIDAPTSASSKAKWDWSTPKFVSPSGHFYGKKRGDNNWEDEFNTVHDFSSYSLDKLQDGKISSIDTFRYYISTYGEPAPWTADGKADDPASYGKKKVTYQISDDELYLNDTITSTTKGDTALYNIPKDAYRLTGKDYQFLYADWSMSAEFRRFSNDEQRFVKDPGGNYSSDDVIHFWAMTSGGEYKEVGSYNMGTKTSSILDPSVVSLLDNKRITFVEAANVTGIKFTTSNAYWYTILEAYPMVRLKNSDYVMKTIKDKKTIRLHNFAQSKAWSSDGKLDFSLRTYAFDRAARPERKSEIHKRVLSTGTNKIKKKYSIRWEVTQRETLRTDSGTSDLVQKSGTFYDLLPKGTHLAKGSVDVKTENGVLSHSSFSYKITSDYKGSGRDLVTVKIPVEARHYTLYLNTDMGWDAVRDYGASILNPVAYETGNEDIAGGYADDGGKLTGENRKFLSGLDSKSSGKKFIYDSRPFNIEIITSAVSGLTKQVRNENEPSYSYETYTTPSGNYSYRFRFANTATSKAKDIVLFDSLENYSLNGKKSDWHGILKRIDISQLQEKGIAPVIYVSETNNLSIDDHHDLKDTTIWKQASGSSDLSKVRAVAIDCRKMTDGTPFTLNAGESITAVAYMNAPSAVADVKGRYATAYNNIYIQDTIINDNGDTPFFIHQDYTAVKYRIAADIGIHKQSTDNANIAVEGARYTLKGTSAYGTVVDAEATTGAQGNATFENIEKGTYKLKESYSPVDWLLDTAEYTVTVDENGRVLFNGTATDRIVLKDAPRIHGDISFMKLSAQKGRTDNPVPGAKFRLEGRSRYGTDVMEYATSTEDGTVRFSNIEWGNYKLKEVQAPDGYILSKTEYDAVISDSGTGGISGAEMLTSGSHVIRNEPYHTVDVSKQSAYDGAALGGAEFRLSGTSDYGSSYDLKATSKENGIASFSGLEAGTYILQETKAPDNHVIDATKRAVRVNADGTYTIDGLALNDSGKYRLNNERQLSGKIIVKKKWNDGGASVSRPEPVIHITTDVSSVPTYAVWRGNYGGANVKSPFYFVDSDYENKTKKVEYANIKAADVPAGAVRLDSGFDDPDAKMKIYGWLTSDGTMHYWTNAQIMKVTDESNYLFYGMKNATSIEVDSRISTKEMHDMSLMFAGCARVTTLDLSSFDTSDTSDMSGMFSGCSSLRSVNLSSFDTSGTSDMNAMFYGCSSLTSLDLSRFNGHSLQDMGAMFSGCSSLTSLKLFATSSSLRKIWEAFKDCGKIETLDLSSLDTSNVTDMERLFSGCRRLKNIYVSDRWSTNQVDDYGMKMFEDCYLLPNFDDWETDISQAEIGKYLSYKAYDDRSEASADKSSSASSSAANSGKTVEYISTDKKNCTITKDGDEWIYEFRVADDSARYYAYEEDVPGYRSSNDVNSYGITTKESPRTIVNTANNIPADPKPASISLYKKVDGKQLDKDGKPTGKEATVPSYYKDKTYMFSIALSNSDASKLAGVKIFGDTVFTDGKAKVGVKPGEKKTFTALPDGTSYTIEEEKYRWFGTESENASGTLNAGDSKTVKFTNHYTPGKVLDYKPGVGFTLKKSVKGWFQKKASYPFGISFRDLSPGEEYSLSDGKSFTADDDGNGYVETSLGDGASVTFSKLPVGAQYRITEQGGDWTSAYKITNASSDGDIEQTADSAEKNASLSTAWETVDAGEDITVDFTNTVKKYQNITLKKKVTGGEAPGRFRFRIDFTNLHDTVRSDAGTIVPEDDGTASADVYLGGGEEMKFSNVPVTAKYQITELANAGTASYAITADKPAKASDSNSGPVKDLATAIETVDEGEDAVIEFTNTLPKSASVTLTKKVGGMFADPNRYFRFTVSLTGASANQDYLIDLTKGSTEHDGKKNPQFLKTDANGRATADIWLKHNDTITLKSLPLDAKYSVAEEKTQGYDATVKANGADVTGISERSVQADSIVFVNSSGGILPTGMHRGHALAFIAVIDVIAIGAAAAFMLRRRKKKEN